jgi:shikimate kinase
MIMENDPTRFSTEKTFKDGRVTSEKITLSTLSPDQDQQQLSDAVGVHIQLADFLDTTPFRECEMEFDCLSKQRTQSTVVIVIGPIGVGKSSVAQKLSDSSLLLEHVDGDILGIGMDRTMNLKAERNDYSIWKILEVLMAGKVPVVSTGGGILFSFKSEFVLRNIIQKALGISVNIIVLVPDNSTQNITELKTIPNLTEIYGNVKGVQEVVKCRVQSGQWKIPGNVSSSKKENPLLKFAEMIADKSKKNKTFGDALIVAADYAFLFPPIKPGAKDDAYLSQLQSLNFDNILKLVTTTQNEIRGRFTQVRILTEIIFPVYKESAEHQIRHITWKYDSHNPIEISLKEMRCIADCSLTEKIDGTLYELSTNNTGKKGIQLIVPFKQLHADGRTHITIDSGPHDAKYMGDVAIAIHNSENTVTLPGSERDQSDKIYNIKNAKVSKCKLVYLDVFGIK